MDFNHRLLWNKTVHSLKAKPIPWLMIDIDLSSIFIHPCIIFIVIHYHALSWASYVFIVCVGVCMSVLFTTVLAF